MFHWIFINVSHIFLVSIKKQQRRQNTNQEQMTRLITHHRLHRNTVWIKVHIHGSCQIHHRCISMRVPCAFELWSECRAWLRSAWLRRSRMRVIEQSTIATVAPVMAENTRARRYHRRRRRRSVPPRLFLASATATATDPATRG